MMMHIDTIYACRKWYIRDMMMHIDHNIYIWEFVYEGRYMIDGT